jgi:hypothetical protein
MNAQIDHYRAIYPNVDVYPIGSAGYVAYDADGHCLGAISHRDDERIPYATHANGRTIGLAHGITEAIGDLIRYGS